LSPKYDKNKCYQTPTNLEPYFSSSKGKLAQIKLESILGWV